ncbi:transcriptional regulator GcvA [Microvirga pakistanensis]|uniref:transcriptional regulator GcvA n=1 Tax=Microvirga pakistanensis TaxID=1682650 RepID=UPI00106953D8|nr:transcriptional regulator GcvA [Microvirga pakistanensis]
MQKLPPMSAVRVFEATARLQSFSRAADELGLTQAAVSYQIKVLEDRLGTSLFTRTARQVSLTETGKRLAPSINEAFQIMRDAFQAVSEGDETVLAITVFQTFAANWLVPRLGGFQLSHPSLAVRLDTSMDLVDLIRGEFDVGIRSGMGDWPGLEVHELFPSRFVPVCSPQFLERAGPLKEPADLLKLPLVSPRDPWWAPWFSQAGVPNVDLTRGPDLNLGIQLLEGASALAGHGVAIVAPAFFANELATGRLIAPFDILAEDGRSYWLVYPKTRSRSAKIRAFRDWLLEEVRTSCVRRSSTMSLDKALLR